GKARMRFYLMGGLVVAVLGLLALIALYFSRGRTPPPREEFYRPLRPTYREERFVAPPPKEEERFEPAMEEPEKRPVESMEGKRLKKFLSKTEEALNQYTKPQIEKHLQRAMHRYATLMSERNHLPKGVDPALERRIDQNLKELEDRIFRR
ncbi:MAG: hypothetical protein ACE5K0_08715, partial [Candidatus Methanofastidiosia archaeon]